MKRNIILTLLFIMCVTLSAQESNDKEIVKNDFETIIKYTNEKQIAKILDMSYPRLFEIVPREVIQNMTDSILNTMGVKLLYTEINPELTIKEPTTLADQVIVMGKYKQSMLMEFENVQMMDVILSIGATVYPDYQLAKEGINKLSLNGDSYIIGIKDSYTNNTWKYLNYSDSKEILEKIFTPETLNAIKQLKTEFK